MAQPDAYRRRKNFAQDDGDETDHRALNSELDDAARTINQIRDRLGLIQRDDGELANNSVGPDQLRPEAFEAFRGDIDAAVREVQDASVEATRSATYAGEAERAAKEAKDAAERAEANAKGAAANAASAAKAALDGIYLGPHDTDPAVDGNGQALTDGDFYYNRIAKLIRTWDAASGRFVNATPSGQFKRPTFKAGVHFTPGVTDRLTLAGYPDISANLFVTFDGVDQDPDQYTLVGNELRFNEPIPDGVTSVHVAYLEAISSSYIDPSQIELHTAEHGTQVLSEWVQELPQITQPSGNEPVGGFADKSSLRAYSGPATRTKVLTPVTAHYKRDGSGSPAQDDGGFEIIAEDGSRWVLDEQTPSVQHFGVVPDGVDKHTQAQAMAETMDAKGYGFMYWPGFTGNYLISDSIKFDLGDIRIFGDSGKRYVHPFTDGTNRYMRQGVIVGAGASIFDLGNYKTKASGSTTPYPSNPARNFAQSWQVDNLALRGQTTGLTHGIAITGVQNGPDRIVTVRDVSGTHLNAGVFIPERADGVTIQLANLSVDNCQFNFGKYGIKSHGWLYGLSVKNCNLEANTEGCIHGVVNSAAEIAHNMLENTKNPINLTPTSNLTLKAYGNYFEYHPTSNYLYRVLGHDSYLIYNLDFGGDITSGGIPSHPLHLSGAGRFTVKNRQHRTLIAGVPAGKVFVLGQGSTLLERFGQLEVSALQGTLVAHVPDGFARTALSGDAAIHFYPHDQTKVTKQHTPLGFIDTIDLADGLRIDVGQTVLNKLVTINLVMRSWPGVVAPGFPAAVLRARTTAGAYVNGPGNIMDYIASDISNGQWCVVSITFKMTNNVQLFELYVDETLRGGYRVAGATVQVHGEYVGDGTDPVVNIKPVCLNRPV